MAGSRASVKYRRPPTTARWSVVGGRWSVVGGRWSATPSRFTLRSSLFTWFGGRTRLGALAGLLGLLAALVLWPAPAGADALSNLQARIGQAQQALKDLAVRRQGQQTVVESLREVTAGYAAELRRADAELLAAVSRLRQAEADLARVEAEAQALEGQIAAQQAAVEQRANVYGVRLRGLYKFTRTSPLEQLLAARDFSDALRRIAMMQAITRVDNRLLSQLRVEHTELLQAREALQQKHVAATTLREEIDQQRQALAARQAEQASLVARAQQEQRQAEIVLTEYDRHARSEAARIVALQFEYQRELEEIERQRQEEQRRQEEARRQEEQRRASLQATAVAQATAAAQATATARAARTQPTAQAGRTPPGAVSGAGGQAAPTAAVGRGNTPPATALGSPGSASPAGGSAGIGSLGRLPTVVPLPGSVQTSGLQPSSMGFIWPVPNPVITTEFGDRTFAQAFHTGIDLAQNLYTPVLAAADGLVLKRGLAVPGKPSQSYGMMVVIGHGTTLSTLYAHLDDGKREPPVKVGDRVKRGQIIGFIGMTGITSGPHLHFEVLVSGDVKNPRGYLPR